VSPILVSLGAGIFARYSADDTPKLYILVADTPDEPWRWGEPCRARFVGPFETQEARSAWAAANYRCRMIFMTTPHPMAPVVSPLDATL
jgi:hypothetical protein